MPRKRIETAFIGAYTLAALDAAPAGIAGALVKRLAAWILRDELPAEIAPELAAPWAMIEAESRTIHAARAQQAFAGSKGGERKANASERQANASERQANASERQAKGYQEEEEEEEEEIDTSPAESADPRARARMPTPTADSGQRTAGKKSFRIDYPADSLEWESRAWEIRDPVDLALAIAGEGAEKRRVFGAILRDMRDAETFRLICIQLGREIRAGDRIDNPGAVLVKKLKNEIGEKK